MTEGAAEPPRLVAAGNPNREIAAALCIGGHTAARHIQNMLAKLACPSRAALAAYGHDQRRQRLTAAAVAGLQRTLLD